MPYLKSLGIPRLYGVREKFEDFFRFVRELCPDMDFHDVKFLEQVLGKHEFTTPSSEAGRTIQQLFCFANDYRERSDQTIARVDQPI